MGRRMALAALVRERSAGLVPSVIPEAMEGIQGAAHASESHLSGTVHSRSCSIRSARGAFQGTERFIKQQPEERLVSPPSAQTVPYPVTQQQE